MDTVRSERILRNLCMLHFTTDGTVRGFRQEFTPEDAIGFPCMLA
jgi:hypothetical protein